MILLYTLREREETMQSPVVFCTRLSYDYSFEETAAEIAWSCGKEHVVILVMIFQLLLVISDLFVVLNSTTQSPFALKMVWTEDEDPLQ